MHELSIAQALVSQVVAAAADHGAQSVSAVEVEVGAMQTIVPEALRAAFEVVSAATVAEGAELSITEVAIGAECRGCGRSFTPEIARYVCPGCGRADAGARA